MDDYEIVDLFFEKFQDFLELSKDEYDNNYMKVPPLTFEQQVFCEYLLFFLKNNYGDGKSVNLGLLFTKLQNEFPEINIGFKDRKIVIDYLKLNNHIEDHIAAGIYKINLSTYKILETFGSLIDYLAYKELTEERQEEEENRQKGMKRRIDELTLKQLQGSIFDVKKWWLPALINLVVTIAAALIVYLITKTR